LLDFYHRYIIPYILKSPEAYAAAVVDVTGGQADILAFQKRGNIKIDAGEIFIYT